MFCFIFICASVLAINYCINSVFSPTRVIHWKMHVVKKWFDCSELLIRAQWGKISSFPIPGQLIGASLFVFCVDKRWDVMWVHGVWQCKVNLQRNCSSMFSAGASRICFRSTVDLFVFCFFLLHSFGQNTVSKRCMLMFYKRNLCDNLVPGSV